MNKLIEPKIFFSILSTIRFSKNEKSSLYSKNKYEEKLLYLPSIYNLSHNINNNNINNTNNRKSSFKINKNKNANKNDKIIKKNETNNYKLNMSNNTMNDKGINLTKKINSSASSKDNIKNNILQYNNKLRRTFKIEKKY